MKKVPFGEFHPQNPVVNAVIENPAGSQQKYEYDEKYEATVLRRVLYDGLKFPFNYGYIPMTKSGDGAHVDVFVISVQPIPSQTVVPARPIGLVEVEDRGERDNKIIAVPLKDKRFEAVETWEDLPEETKNKLVEFYEHFPKQVEHDIQVKGFFGKQKAIEELRLTQI